MRRCKKSDILRSYLYILVLHLLFFKLVAEVIIHLILCFALHSVFHVILRMPENENLVYFHTQESPKNVKKVI